MQLWLQRRLPFEPVLDCTVLESMRTHKQSDGRLTDGG